MWSRLKALRKERTPIVLFGSEPFSSALRMSNIKEYKYDWVWNKKKKAGFLNAKTQPLRVYENISIFNKHDYFPQMTKGKMRNKKSYNKTSGVYSDFKLDKDNFNDLYYPKNIIEVSNASQKGKQHPTQKPLALMEYLINTYTNEGDLVLDFTAGSFTTGVACLNTNRQFIGIEKDEGYFAIGKKRMEDRQKELE